MVLCFTKTKMVQIQFECTQIKQDGSSYNTPTLGVPTLNKIQEIVLAETYFEQFYTRISKTSLLS